MKLSKDKVCNAFLGSLQFFERVSFPFYNAFDGGANLFLGSLLAVEVELEEGEVRVEDDADVIPTMWSMRYPHFLIKKIIKGKGDMRKHHSHSTYFSRKKKQTPWGHQQYCHVRNGHSGAGIVPIRKSEGGEIEFLLGKERFVPGWVGSFTYSGLEGSVKGLESVEDNASREAYEESAGLLFDSIKEEALCLKRGEYVLRISVQSGAKEHITYVKEYPSVSSGDFCKTFQETITYLSSFKTKRTWRKKKEIEDEGERKSGREGEATETDTDDSSSDIVFKGGCGGKIPPNFACEWHPALKTIFRRNGGIEYSVLDDFLEKTELRWFTLQQLRDALCGKCDVKLRPMFETIVRELLVQFDSNSNSIPALSKSSESSAPPATPPDVRYLANPWKDVQKTQQLRRAQTS